MDKGTTLFIKRALDVLISGVGLIAMLPLFFLVGILIKVTMPGPVFFTQRRVGMGGRVFYITKFRTMAVNKELEMEAEEVKVDSSKDKERTTKVGKVLRRLKVDEIPQLIHVLKGEMSLVGPRPVLERQASAYDNYQRQRLLVRPGMTGLAQVSGGTELPWDDRIDLDLHYIRNLSLVLDAKIILRTFVVVILGERFLLNRFIDS